jgi:hypothetical protein
MKERVKHSSNEIWNLKKLSSNENDEIGAQENAKGKTNILSDAIHNARKMNPKLGFKR